MINTRRLILAASLVLVVTVAAAAPIKQGPAESVADTECPGTSASMMKMIGGALPGQPFVQEAEEDNITGSDDIIEEYLSFHAQVTERNGKSSLMPWSGLRPHAN